VSTPTTPTTGTPGPDVAAALDPRVAVDPSTPTGLLDPTTALIHSGEYQMLAALESGLAEGYERQRQNVGNRGTLLARTLDLAAAGCRRRAAHYAMLARSLQAYATAPSPDPDPVLAALDPLAEAQTERFLGGDLTGGLGEGSAGVPRAS